ncbi:hypothetical protein F4804DRAFT_304189 [Jackrogersella minutella]|nr:hypothetical protein F4804DRAFT_304189 [Jackrogersella minutella]
MMPLVPVWRLLFLGQITQITQGLNLSPIRFDSEFGRDLSALEYQVPGITSLSSKNTLGHRYWLVLPNFNWNISLHPNFGNLVSSLHTYVTYLI